VLRGVSRWIDRGVEWAVIVLFMIIAVVGGLQVFFRYALNLPLAWSEGVQIYGHIWIVFLTVPIAYNRGAHIVTTMIFDRFPPRFRKTLAVAVDVVWLWLGASIFFYTIRLVRVAAFQMSPSIGIPMSYVYLGMLAGAAYMVLVAARKIAGHFPRGDVGGIAGHEAAP
jgi:TRAP-type C4-dicarboxylate transport system permease small subunit